MKDSASTLLIPQGPVSTTPLLCPEPPKIGDPFAAMAVNASCLSAPLQGCKAQLSEPSLGLFKETRKPRIHRLFPRLTAHKPLFATD